MRNGESPVVENLNHEKEDKKETIQLATMVVNSRLKGLDKTMSGRNRIALHAHGSLSTGKARATARRHTRPWLRSPTAIGKAQASPHTF
jgi:hypothetical protein